MVAMKEPKDEVKSSEQSLVCSILIKKEDTEEKPKGASSVSKKQRQRMWVVKALQYLKLMVK